MTLLNFLFFWFFFLLVHACLFIYYLAIFQWFFILLIVSELLGTVLFVFSFFPLLLKLLAIAIFFVMLIIIVFIFCYDLCALHGHAIIDFSGIFYFCLSWAFTIFWLFYSLVNLLVVWCVSSMFQYLVPFAASCWMCSILATSIWMSENLFLVLCYELWSIRMVIQCFCIF